MTKAYIDQLSEWVKKRENKRRKDFGLVAFLAVKSDVESAIEAGYALKTIWAHLKETSKISCRYETFLKYVKKHIKGKKKVEKKIVPETPKSKKKPDSTGPRKLDTKPKEFEVNPVVNKEDLI